MELKIDDRKTDKMSRKYPEPYQVPPYLPPTSRYLTACLGYVYPGQVVITKSH